MKSKAAFAAKKYTNQVKSRFAFVAKKQTKNGTKNETTE